MSGTLYVVPTPIGNLGDLSPRAAETLAAAAVIACEDTRTSRPLLDRVGARGQRVALHEHNEQQRAAGLVERLRAGEDVALISDAGTPLVSDPGSRLVRAAIAAGIGVVVLPGPCAAITALAASGIDAERFTFIGFLPRKAGPLRDALSALADQAGALIFYEAGNRVVGTLRAVGEVLGDRPVAVGRELSKLHEEVLRGTVAEVADVLAARERVLGEVTLVVGGASGPPDEAARWSRADALIAGLLAEGLSGRRVRDLVAEALDLSRKEVYARVLAAGGG